MEFFFPGKKGSAAGGAGAATGNNIYGARAGIVNVATSAAVPAQHAVHAVGLGASPFEAAAAAAPAPAAPAPAPPVNQALRNTFTVMRSAARTSARANQELRAMRRNMINRFRTAVNNARARGNAAAVRNLGNRARKLLTITQQWRSRKSRSVNRRFTRKHRK